MPPERREDLEAVARRVWAMAEAGLGHLAQRAWPKGRCAYLLIVRPTAAQCAKRRGLRAGRPAQPGGGGVMEAAPATTRRSTTCACCRSAGVRPSRPSISPCCRRRRGHASTSPSARWTGSRAPSRCGTSSAPSALSCRSRQGHGTARFQDGNVEVTADLPKKVEWDQRRSLRSPSRSAPAARIPVSMSSQLQGGRAVLCRVAGAHSPGVRAGAHRAHRQADLPAHHPLGDGAARQPACGQRREASADARCASSPPTSGRLRRAASRP